MKNAIFSFLAALFLLSSCGSSIEVTSDYDKSVDFTKYKTYSYLGWSKNSDELMNDFDKRRIESAFAYEFEIRGLKHVLLGGDIEVSLFLVTDQKTAVTAYTDYYGTYYGGYRYGGYPGGWGMGMSSTTYHESDYEVGTLVCDVFDGKEKRLVWQSVGTKTIEQSSSERDVTIPKAIAKMMSLYPVQVPQEKK